MNKTRNMPVFIYILLGIALILFSLAACSKQDNDQQTSEAISGIAFLIIDANFNESSARGTSEGISYSKQWLSEQPVSLKEDLKKRCEKLALLIIDLNMKFLEKMIDETNLPYSLADDTVIKYENFLQKNSDFDSEWLSFKQKQIKYMEPKIKEFHNQLISNRESKEAILKKTKDLYVSSQAFLIDAMNKRIQEIFY